MRPKDSVVRSDIILLYLKPGFHIVVEGRYGSLRVVGSLYESLPAMTRWGSLTVFGSLYSRQQSVTDKIARFIVIGAKILSF